MPRGRVKEEGQRGRLGFEGRKLGGEGYCPRCTVLSSYLGGHRAQGVEMESSPSRALVSVAGCVHLSPPQK